MFSKTTPVEEAPEDTETIGRSALPAQDERWRRLGSTCTNGKDERATRCILMPFVEAEDKRNKHFSIAEASLTIEVQRSSGLTGTQNTAETSTFSTLHKNF